jgi:hypothetical protein
MHMLMLQLLESFKGYVLDILLILLYVVLCVQTCMIVFIPHGLLAFGQHSYLRYKNHMYISFVIWQFHSVQPVVHLGLILTFTPRLWNDDFQSMLSHRT